MSRRKQANPRALKRDDIDESSTDMTMPICEVDEDTMPTLGLNGGGVGTPTSWRSSDTPDDQSLSLSPTSCATPSDPDTDLTYTIGVTENTPYACQFCDKAFPRLSYLKRHEQIHSDQMPFKCDYCQRLFKHKRSRDRHIKLHTGDRKYRCPHCESAFSRSDHLKIHLKTHDNAKPFQCTVCNRGYNTAAALTSHMQNHKKDNQSGHSPFRCLQCSASFNSSRDLQFHVNTHRDDSSSPADKTSQCAFCPLSRLTPESMKQHVEQVHPAESQGKCSICQETFLSVEAMCQHRKLHKEEPESQDFSNTNLTCGFCSKGEFSTLDELQAHVQANHVADQHTSITSIAPYRPQSRTEQSPCNYDCEYCTMKFSTVHSLQQHTLTVHSYTDIITKCRENMYCFQCNMVFTSVSTLTEHVRNVHETQQKSEPHDQPVTNGRKKIKPEEPVLYNGAASQFHHPNTLLCSQCNAAFPDFESFRNHLKTHLDVVKFACSECDGEFGTEDQLDSHIITHFLSTSTEYGCQCCLKLFTKPDELQKHLMDIHAHHLYRCALCKEMFDSKVSIQVHFAVKHSNECRLFQCTTCNSVFRTEMEFQLHVKVAHLSKHQPYRCLLCELSFPTELQLQYHLQGHKKQFVCPLCDEAFHVEFLLDRHLQTRHAGETMAIEGQETDDSVQNLSMKSSSRHNTSSPPSEHRKALHCELCDSVFPSEASLSSHRRQAHNVRTQKAGQSTVSLFCAYCNESCKSRTELENHMKSHTVSPSKHKCNICDEICPSATTLAEHKLTHCKVVSGSTCVVCRLVLKSEEQFYSHIQQHNSGLPTPCVVCRQTLMSDVEVQIHAKFHLKNCDTLYSCCVCARQLEVSNLIITGKHESMHTYMCKECFHSKAEDLRCPECQVKFESLSELEKHKHTHKKTYQCIKCQMSFETEGEIQLHVATHVLQEGTNHECNLCHKVFDSPAKLQCHLIEHTFEGCSSYACYICSAVFTSPHLIQSHMLDHGLNSRPYDCNQCHQRFFFRAELEHHGIAHNHCNQLQCPDCNKVFSNIVNLNNHRKIHEQKGSTLKCSLCPEVFYSSADMQQHHFRCHGDMDHHEGKKYFPCTECEKVFPCLSNLQGHMRIHTQGTKYTCPQCNKEFALSRNLNIHMRSHSGEKPYECPICKKRFARKENRKAHLKSHTGLKPFMCPHCGKTFSRKCHVKEHMRIHITSTTHPCEMCEETFSSTRQLRKHMVAAHKKQYDHVCTVCGDIFDEAKELDRHLQRTHQVLTTNVENNSTEDVMSESSPGRSSSSGDTKDVESSECSSVIEDGGDSPVSATDENTQPSVDGSN